MIESLPVIAAALVAGLLGSAHCLGMCAGISGLFAAGPTEQSNQFPFALAYNAGRVASYAFLGAVVAAIGSAFVGGMPTLAGPVRLFSGLLIVLIGLQVAFTWRVLAPLEKMGAKLWSRIAPLAKGLIPASSIPRAFALGIVWGWLPCGLVYSALLVAASTASITGGAIAMMAFGIGTMPAMVLTGLGAAKLAGFVSRNRVAAGLLIVVLGLATLAMPVMTMTATEGAESPHHH